MKTSKRNPPEKIKRKLRQEAAFGCCKCGRPIFQYHHIIPWAKIQKHDAKQMMILCPNCHDEVTKGSMTEKEQRDYKSEPINVKNGYSHGLLKINNKYCNIVIGTNTFDCIGKVIVIDGEEIIGARLDENGNLEFSLKLYDESDNLVFNIQNNEWITGDIIPWDIKSGYQNLIIQKKNSEIILEIDTKVNPIKIRANLWKNHVNIKIDENQLWSSGGPVQYITLKECSFQNTYLKFDTVSNILSI
jgi:uncharacterized CHY-type Zn-finger protein